MPDPHYPESPQLKILRRALSPFSFLKHEAAGGVVLFVAAVLALLTANSYAGEWYDRLLHTPVSVGIPPLVLEKTLIHWVNDGLMVLFFFLVGLEIKRELLVGALSNTRRALLPLIGAMGGMAAPALIYAFINQGDPVALRGWAIPAATDIAFAVGVIALLGSRVPSSLKVFILALAIIDDLGAILIIAVFYTDHLSMIALVLALFGSIVLVALNRFGVKAISPYLVLGVLIWLCVLQSGVHATVAGVVTALAIPLAAGDDVALKGPLERIQHALAPWISFGVLPIFAFANAGVSLTGVGVAQMVERVPLGIALGLLLGKSIGIFGSAWAAIKSGRSPLPADASWAQLFGVALLGGIGFTMSLFIGTLAFPDPEHAAEIRIGVLSGSTISALLGYILLSAIGRSNIQTQ